MIAAAQHGVSKKSGKPYSMITLEDLHGSVQVLVMNENYDKFRQLLELNKAIMVVGEVNTGEDRPKIFPQEIFPLDDAPKKFTKRVTFHCTRRICSRRAWTRWRSGGRASGPMCELMLCFRYPTGQTFFVQPTSVTA
jgi:DNA polymerase III alpha subunit